MYYNIIYMAIVTLLFWILGDWMVALFTTDEAIQKVAAKAGRIIASGYIFYGIGMVMINTFNGAGDTWTPTIINICGFWFFQIPLAYLLSKYYAWGPTGVFIAVPVAETVITITSFILFKKGKWKQIKV